jgi:hypothetical protein
MDHPRVDIGYQSARRHGQSSLFYPSYTSSQPKPKFFWVGIQLKEVGLDFGFLLSSVLSKHDHVIRNRRRLTRTGKPRALSADPARPRRLPSTLLAER